MSLKKECIEFLSVLEGYHQLLKTLHWNTTSHAKHVLSDDIDEDILEYEDRLAEIMMGHFNERFSVGSLKSFLPESRDLKSLLKELDTDLDKYSKTLSNDGAISSLTNTFDDFKESVAKWKYLETLD